MLARYAIRELLHHRLRTLLAVAGVSVSAAMLVDMSMLGGGLEASFTELLAGRGYTLRIAPKGTLPFDTEAIIERFSTLEDTLLRTEGVEGVAPLLGRTVELEARLAPVRRVLALGVDPAEQGVYRLLEGRDPSSGGVVLDRRLADEAGLARGDTVVLALDGALGAETRRIPVRVEGIAEFLYAAREERAVALPIDRLGALADRPDAAAFAMIRLRDGADPESVRDRLAEAAPRIDAYTIDGLVERAQARLSYFRQLAIILGTVAIVVTALLVGTIAAVSINERYGTIAVLRAIGISRRSLLGALALESLALTAVSVVLGLALGLATARYLDSVLAGFPGLPQSIRFFVLRPGSLALSIAGVLGVATLSALVPAWRVTRLDISRTLHAEEP